MAWEQAVWIELSDEGLEDIADPAGDVGPRGDDLAALLDGCLLEAIEIVQQLLPFGLEAPGAAQAVQFLGEGQCQEGTENVAADRGVSLVKLCPKFSCVAPAYYPPVSHRRISALIRSAVVRTCPWDRSSNPALSKAATSACTRRY